MNEVFKVEHCGSIGIGLIAVRNIKSGTAIVTQKPVISISTDGIIFYSCLGEKIILSENFTSRLSKICCDRHGKFFQVLKYVNGKAINNNAKVGPCMIKTLFLIVTEENVNVWSHSNYEKVMKNQSSFALANIAREALLNFGIDKSIKDILRVITCISENSFSIENNHHVYGSALYKPPITKVNHSCNPNCTIKFSANVITMEALRDIRAGKQLFISYTYNVQPRNVRQANLLEQYGFECKCVYCYGVKAEYREAMLRFNFCPNKDCRNSAKEVFEKIVELPLDDEKVMCRIAFRCNYTEYVPKSVATSLGLLGIDGDYMKCWKCNSTWSSLKLCENESLLVEGVRKDILYKSLNYTKNWIHTQNLIFGYWLSMLSGHKLY
ncbi:Histone-lysine N-methyltransferase SMYD3 [Babesia microti strain RI]|uniref:Histone-lysine N-methyltransferase SMYD3 n=1 Tax=Babesia microti (strain RI) TaxID=1133968 RepID=I7I8B3_BABMR|nr:Histone-lysine N-methyltransferase SMYD3 [Babesia microti strain RI]CCF73008.1 Histone-lysine N-methyltransferase SMYD3 [Babesia microti strain RI]|eukprot:XP_012647617.1 Histone-lysine N-methyltransferase SMYD3 [Babesia microti strain RI]